MSLRPIRLEIEGFRSFRQKSVFEFPGSGLVLISGKWAGSDVSSGSGKSAILMAIAYALDVCDVPATDLKNYDSKKISVQLTLSDGTNTYVITRDPKISLIINNVPYDGLAKGAKEKLTEILQISPNLVKDLTYREQRTKGKFINSTDSQKKEFLSELLGLSAFEDAADQYGKEISSLQTSIQMITNDLANANSTLSMLAVSEEEILAANQAVESASARVQELKGQYSVSVLNEQVASVAKLLSEANNLKSQVANISYAREMSKTTLIALKQEIDSLKASICPTCNRSWDAQQELLAQKNNQFCTLLEQFEKNGIFISQSQPTIAQIPLLEAQRTELLAKIGAAQVPATDAQRALDSANQILQLLLRKRSDKINTAARIQTKTEELAAKQERLVVAEHCSKIVGRNGFMGSIFDEVLREIETRTNDMLGYLPNVSQYTISLSSTTITKTAGVAKKEISTKIYKNGKEASYKSLSGGQQVALELCADLAYAETIRNRSGNVLGWVCLDEAMEGFGVEEKQAAVGMIREKVRGLVLVIDHATEIKEGFEKVIEISYNGRESYVS